MNREEYTAYLQLLVWRGKRAAAIERCGGWRGVGGRPAPSDAVQAFMGLLRDRRNAASPRG